MDGVGIIEFARPDKLNAICALTLELTERFLDEFEADRAVRAILLRAQGNHFCTGKDLSEVSGYGRNGSEAGRSSKDGHRLLRRFESSRLPVIFAVQGLALAGGLEFVLAADIVFAAEDARFGDQHAQFGLMPGWGGTQRLPRVVGMRRALDLMFSARWIDAATAQQWGLANYVVAGEQLQEAALDYCRKLARSNPDGLAWMKRLSREGMATGLAEGLRKEERAIPLFLESDNVAEGIAAFREKRKPEFR
jgi:enoyl-CoA hydratase